MTGATGSLDVIPEDECFDLLATQEVGRLGVLAGDRPQIVPVNYGLDGRSIVVRTHSGATLTACREHPVVAFEVDEIDRVSRRGWSVLVSGRAGELDPAQRDDLVHRMRATDVEPWAPGEHGTWLRISPQQISGRRIVPGRLPWGIDERAYL